MKSTNALAKGFAFFPSPLPTEGGPDGSFQGGGGIKRVHHKVGAGVKVIRAPKFSAKYQEVNVRVGNMR